MAFFTWFNSVECPFNALGLPILLQQDHQQLPLPFWISISWSPWFTKPLIVDDEDIQAENDEIWANFLACQVFSSRLPGEHPIEDLLTLSQHRGLKNGIRSRNSKAHFKYKKNNSMILNYPPPTKISQCCLILMPTEGKFFHSLLWTWMLNNCCFLSVVVKLLFVNRSSLGHSWSGPLTNLFLCKKTTLRKPKVCTLRKFVLLNTSVLGYFLAMVELEC